MRRGILLLLVVLSLGLPGCTWDTVKRSFMASMYNSFGDGYGADRFSDFDRKYEEQSKAASEYYQEHP